MIGVAAAVQYAVFPVWIGIGLVRGFSDSHLVLERVATFGINVVTVAVAALAAYAWAGMRRGEALHFRRKARSF